MTERIPADTLAHYLRALHQGNSGGGPEGSQVQDAYWQAGEPEGFLGNIETLSMALDVMLDRFAIMLDEVRSPLQYAIDHGNFDENVVRAWSNTRDVIAQFKALTMVQLRLSSAIFNEVHRQSEAAMQAEIAELADMDAAIQKLDVLVDVS